MAHEPVLWCAALPETLIAIASRPQKTFGGGLSLAFFLGSSEAPQGDMPPGACYYNTLGYWFCLALAVQSSR